MFLCILSDVGSLRRYVTGDICFMISYGLYLLGVSALEFEGALILKLRPSNHTLLPGTKVLGTLSGLMRFCNTFCASNLALSNWLSRSCAAGTASSGVLIDAVGFMPMINSCGEYLVFSCFHELCANSAIGRSSF